MSMMDLIMRAARNRRAKAKLTKAIKLNNGRTLKKGTVSDLLIDKGDGTYHFEANDTACTVTSDEIEMIA